MSNLQLAFADVLKKGLSLRGGINIQLSPQYFSAFVVLSDGFIPMPQLVTGNNEFTVNIFQAGVLFQHLCAYSGSSGIVCFLEEVSTEAIQDKQVGFLEIVAL